MRIAQGVLVLYTLWFLIVWISEREVFRVNVVHVIGAHDVSPDDVAELVRGIMNTTTLGVRRDTTLFLPRERISDSVFRESDGIINVGLSIDDHVLTIRVDERAPGLLWCSPDTDIPGEAGGDGETMPAEGCYYASPDGYIYSPAPIYAGYPFPVYRSYATSGPSERLSTLGAPIGLYILPRETLEKVEGLRRELVIGGYHIRDITALPDGDFSVRVDRPWKILWSPTLSPAEALRRLQLTEPVIAEGKGSSDAPPVSVVDLRFGNKIFYH